MATWYNGVDPQHSTIEFGAGDGWWVHLGTARRCPIADRVVLVRGVAGLTAAGGTVVRGCSITFLGPTLLLSSVIISTCQAEAASASGPKKENTVLGRGPSHWKETDTCEPAP